MRADNNVDEPLAYLSDDCGLFLLRTKTRHHVQPDAIACKAVLERAKVLRRENRCRHENSHLLPVEHRLEGRPDGNLRLPETDVAADQPVHRMRRLHVSFHFDCRLGLVARVFIDEGRLQLLLPRSIL